jgi:hypothetical protein
MKSHHVGRRPRRGSLAVRIAKKAHVSALVTRRLEPMKTIMLSDGHVRFLRQPTATRRTFQRLDIKMFNVASIAIQQMATSMKMRKQMHTTAFRRAVATGTIWSTVCSGSILPVPATATTGCEGMVSDSASRCIRDMGLGVISSSKIRSMHPEQARKESLGVAKPLLANNATSTASGCAEAAPCKILLSFPLISSGLPPCMRQRWLHGSNMGGSPA